MQVAAVEPDQEDRVLELRRARRDRLVHDLRVRHEDRRRTQLLRGWAGGRDLDHPVRELRIADKDGRRILEHPAVGAFDPQRRRPAIARLVDLHAAVLDVVVDLDALRVDQPAAIIDADLGREVPGRAGRPEAGAEAIDLDLEARVLTGELPLAQVVIVRAGFDETVPLYHRGIADEAGRLAVD